jgi:hypothetical protein
MRFLRDLAGIFVGKIVLRAQLIPIGELRGLKYIWAKLFYTSAEIAQMNRLWDEFKEKNNQHAQHRPHLTLKINRNLVKTPQGVSLDTIELQAKHKAPTEYVIYGWGRSDCYEFYLSRLASDALNLNKKIVSFNFRGIAHSKGQVYHGRDLVDDYKSQIMRLIKQGVSPEKIKCYGHSLCGAIATFAVEELNREGYPVKVYDDRSFASLVETSVALYFKRPHVRARIVNIGTVVLQTVLLASVAALGLFTMTQVAIAGAFALLSVRLKLTHQLYDKTIGKFMEGAMRFIMNYGGWEYFTPKIYENIPEENRMHTVIRTPKSHFSKFLGRRKIKHPAFDKVIQMQDSLHRHLSKYHKQKTELKQQFIKANQKSDHNKIAALKAKLVEMSNAKMTGGGHMTDPQELVTWYKAPHTDRWLTGQERFYAFVEPEGKHQEAKTIKYKSF